MNFLERPTRRTGKLVRTMSDVASNIVNVQGEISRAARAVHRHPREITLVAVSKTRDVGEIAAAADAGLRHFGENYLQEAVPKILALEERRLEWHFIGRIQSNKTAEIARHFDWVQTLDREKHARRLNEQRPEGRKPLNVCIQVNISGEPQKGGVDPDAVTQFAQAMLQLPRLHLRGLMGMAAADADPARIGHEFDQLLGAFMALQRGVRSLDTLSMGMSNDYPIAIGCGANMVRIGSAIFGERLYSARPNGQEG